MGGGGGRATSTCPSTETLPCCHHLSPDQPAHIIVHRQYLNNSDNACALLAVDLPTKRSPACSTWPEENITNRLPFPDPAARSLFYFFCIKLPVGPWGLAACAVCFLYGFSLPPVGQWKTISGVGPGATGCRTGEQPVLSGPCGSQPGWGSEGGTACTPCFYITYNRPSCAHTKSSSYLFLNPRLSEPAVFVLVLSAVLPCLPRSFTSH